jgi:2-haloacid dehalogenase
MLDFAGVEALTFDCYGTLIDWERSLLDSLRPILRVHAIEIADDALLELYARLESDLESGVYRPYREVLAGVTDGLGERFGFAPSAEERAALAASVARWPPFEDTVPALKRLKTRFKLGVISNIDDDLFAGTARHLEVGFGLNFDWLVTAQQARAYKPATRPFELALERIGLPRERVIHVAQSLFHDHVPARQLGLRTVWVNRRGARPGFGATPPASAQPDLEVASLAELAQVAVPESC